MARTLEVALLPTLVASDVLAGRAVIVIDVLRATTTICTALAAGAREVLPTADVETARRLAAQPREQAAVLGGERGGLAIRGFDLGNSPCEYTAESIAGRTLIFTTTNGTRALEQARQAAEVWCGAFVNAGAVAKAVAQQPSLVLLCAGTDGHITREDTLLAGCLVYRLMAIDNAWQPDRAKWNDQAQLAADAWRGLTGQGSDPANWPTTSQQTDHLAAALRESRGGRNLVELKLERDILAAAQINQYDLAPKLDVAAWRIVGDAAEI